MSPHDGPEQHSGKRRLGRTLLDDLGRGDLQRSWKQDWQDLMTFYLDDEHRRRLASMNRLERFFSRAGWILRNLFLRLTPARRILVGIAAVLFVLPSLDFGLRGLTLKLHLNPLSFFILLFVLMLELKDKLVAHDELEVGREVQRALLPADHPKLPGWDIWMYTRPANNVGGDLVDYLRVDEDRLALTLGDVAGKGLGAALLMAKLQATLRAVVSETRDLAELGGRVNAILHRDGVPGKFATLVYLELAPGSGTVKLLNAGHLPPSVLRSGGLETLEPQAPPIGILPDLAFVEQRVDLAPGDLMAVFSDGLPEAVNEAGEFFADERVNALLAGLRSCSAAEAGNRVLWAVADFVRHARPHDDLSLIFLKRL